MLDRRLMAIAMTVALAACASNQSGSTYGSTVSTSSGDVALMDDATGSWADDVNGTWMDSTGAVWYGRDRRAYDYQPTTIGSLTNANVLAHVKTGDSLEIALSQRGVERAHSAVVRDFAKRMVREHSDHLQMELQTAQQGSVTPILDPIDTVDVAVGSRMTKRLKNTLTGTDFDREFIRDEVMLHQHMLHDLTTLQPQASGPVRDIVDMTLPVVRQHLADAKAIARAMSGSRSWWNGPAQQ